MIIRQMLRTLFGKRPIDQIEVELTDRQGNTTIRTVTITGEIGSTLLCIDDKKRVWAVREHHALDRAVFAIAVKQWRGKSPLRWESDVGR